MSSREDSDVLARDSRSESAPSEESCDVEIEDDDVIEETIDNGTVYDWATRAEKELDFGESRELTRELNNPDAQTTKPKSDNLLEKLLSSRVGFVSAGTPKPLLTPQEFSVSPTRSSTTSDPVAKEQDEGTTDNTGQRTIQESEPQKEKEEKELNSVAPESSV